MADKAKLAQKQKEELDAKNAAATTAQAKSEFRVYLEQHPEASQELLKVLVRLYQDPAR